MIFMSFYVTLNNKKLIIYINACKRLGAYQTQKHSYIGQLMHLNYRQKFGVSNFLLILFLVIWVLIFILIHFIYLYILTNILFHLFVLFNK